MIWVTLDFSFIFVWKSTFSVVDSILGNFIIFLKLREYIEESNVML